MPELPEVQTTVNGLNKKVLKRAFVNVWTDWEKIVRRPNQSGGGFEAFKKEIKDKRIKKVWRRAKNIIFELSGGYSLLVHQKMTGHLLIGNWKLETGNWNSMKNEALKDPMNQFIHLMFYLSGGLMLALSDLRKFAKVELWKTKELLDSKEFKELGPEPLKKGFTFDKFKIRLRPDGASARRRKIKQVLMDQKIISGIGNIYSSEVLWRAKIHPEKDVADLTEKELKLLYQAIKRVLELGIKLGGESFSDYRKPDGSKGGFDAERKIYRREGQKCSRCGAKIKRLKVGRRSAFYCPSCQK